MYMVDALTDRDRAIGSHWVLVMGAMAAEQRTYRLFDSVVQATFLVLFFTLFFLTTRVLRVGRMRREDSLGSCDSLSKYLQNNRKICEYNFRSCPSIISSLSSHAIAHTCLLYELVHNGVNRISRNEVRAIQSLRCSSALHAYRYRRTYHQLNSMRLRQRKLVDHLPAILTRQLCRSPRKVPLPRARSLVLVHLHVFVLPRGDGGRGEEDHLCRRRFQLAVGDRLEEMREVGEEFCGGSPVGSLRSRVENDMMDGGVEGRTADTTKTSTSSKSEESTAQEGAA